jgi:hypothetical protein
MLGIELSALSVPELRRLLEVARTRKQEALAQALVAELEARPGRMAGLRQAPMVMPELMQSRRAPPSPRRGLAMAVAASAAVVGALLAWALSANLDLRPPTRPQPVALAAADTGPRLAVALTSVGPESPLLIDPAAPAEAANQTEAEEPIAPPAHPLRQVRARPAPARTNPCYDLPTARERLICGYPSIALQDQRLKQAYGRALAAGADPHAIEGAQAEWRQASAEISDRKALFDRYDGRIRELDAAAAALQPPF